VCLDFTGNRLRLYKGKETDFAWEWIGILKITVKNRKMFPCWDALLPYWLVGVDSDSDTSHDTTHHPSTNVCKFRTCVKV
jgi:hypothetical protein